MSQIHENKETIRQLVEEVYGGDLDRLDRFVAAHYRDHGRWHDRDGLRTMLEAFRTAYPDVRFAVTKLLGEGDEVAARFECDCGGREAPQEKHFDVIAIFRFERGKVVEQWSHSDSFF